MAMTADNTLNEFVECTVCGTDTANLCSPCGDPVCHNCACPNGCETLLAEPASFSRGRTGYAEVAA
jgi:hypothetical protein